MKRWILLLITASVMSSSHAQVVATPDATAANKPVAQRTKPGKQIRPAVKVPQSLRPSAAARVSTAQGEAARGNKPGLKKLPDFPVTTREGLVVSSQTLTQNTRWLLVFRRDDCIACDRLMNVLAAGSSVEPGQGLAYAVIVAGKNKDSLDKVRAAYSSLVNAKWVSDRDDVAIKVLKLHGAPVIYGMDGANIKWIVPGNLGNPANVEKMATNWVSGRTVTPVTVPATTPAATSAGK